MPWFLLSGSQARNPVVLPLLRGLWGLRTRPAALGESGALGGPEEDSGFSLGLSRP